MFGFEWKTDFFPSVEQVYDEQYRRGYHPAGYGCYRIRTEKLPDGKYFTTWTCASSCD